MKKFIMLIAAILLLCVPVNGQDLSFSPDSNGYFIYSNNPEAVTDDILANGVSPSYIMNNENLDTGMYYLYLSHFNYTGSGKMGYDIELDAEITASQDCSIIIHDSDFETGRALSYDNSGRQIRYESDWGCLNACAGMLNMPIISADGENIYHGHEFAPVSVTLKKGETTWLSKYLPDYKTTHFAMPVHIQAKIEIISGSADINVAAFRHSGVLGDRSGFSREKTSFGKYRRDRCLKGVANSLPQVTADLCYTIDDKTVSGECLPVTIHNQYVPDGAQITKWVTNLNPQDDIWSKRTSAENDMLPLYYKDDSKYELYGSKIAPDERDNVWVFDTTRSDTRQYEAGFPVSREYYVPNYALDVNKDNQGYGCSMGNYGVTTSYRLSITNNGSKTRYFEYRATTSANLIVYLSDKDNKSDFAVSKTMSYPAKSDILASKELPPGETTVFYLNVILPVNYNGGTQNEFMINDAPLCPDYHSKYESCTEKNFYDNSDYVTNYKNEMPQKTLDEFYGNLESYELVSSGKYKAARLCIWDGLPNFYYNMWGYSKLIFMDNDFNILNVKSFDSLPVSLKCVNGIFYADTARNGIFASYDGKEWWSVPCVPDELNTHISNISGWAEHDIGKMFSNGFFPDNMGTLFASQNTTRLQFCRIAYNMMNKIGLMDNTAPEIAFADTDDFACSKLCEAKIVLGTGNNLFNPNAFITREEAAVILCRMAKYMYPDMIEPENELSFSDSNDISDWAADSVRLMFGAGIMKGMSAEIFSPKSYYTAEQTAATMIRLWEYKS